MIRIGIDLGGTNIAIGAVDETFHIVAREQIPTAPARGPEAVIADMARGVEMVLKGAGCTDLDCASVGIGSPGSCDRGRGTVTRAHNLGWFGVPVVQMLEQRLGLPVHLENDGNCAALGEVLVGAAWGCSSAVMVTFGTGVGGGIVLDGKIYSGNRSLGGELGHMLLVYGGEECTCGRRGCWEAYASATALIRQAERACEDNPTSLLREAPITGASIFEAAARGDATAQEVVATYLRYVGAGLTDLVNLLYPEKVVLGGGIANAGAAFLEPVQAYLQGHAFCQGEPSLPQVVLATLGNDAGIIGAAMLG
jgi:glucokinase-like ROK family protein